MLKCVIFDMDGTLLDTERLAVRFWTEMGRKHGVEIPIEFLAGNCGRPRVENIKRYREHYPSLPVMEMMSQRGAWWQEQIAAGQLRMKPGARELLEYLGEQGIKAVVATSTAHELAEEELTQVGLRPLLGEIISGDMMPEGRGKPEPDIFLLAMERAGFGPEDCLVVEDSENGCEAGIASGAKTVMIPDLVQPNQGLRQRLYRCLDSLTELIPVVETLLT